MRKKLFAVLLVLVMVMTLLPVMALAVDVSAGDQNYSITVTGGTITLPTQTITAKYNNGTYVIESDVEITVTAAQNYKLADTPKPATTSEAVTLSEFTKAADNKGGTFTLNAGSVITGDITITGIFTSTGSSGNSGTSSSSGSGSGSTTTSTPSTSGNTTTVEMTTTSSTSGTTASATVNSSNMNKAVSSAVAEAAKQGTAPVVEIDVKTSSRADSLSLTLPTASLKTLAKTDGSSLSITSGVASVSLDHTALAALADKAGGSNISLEVAPVKASSLNAAQKEAAGNGTVMDLSLVSNKVAIHDYNNGTITVSLPYTLPSGKSASDIHVYYMDDNGALTPCAASFSNGEVTFTTTHFSMYVISDEELTAAASFNDVAADAYYAEAVAWAVKNNVTDGIDDGMFGPATSVTRGQAMTFLWRAADRPAAKGAQNMFTDVPENEYYAEAVAWAVENGITDGYGDTTFEPGLPVTNAQMLTFLARAMGATTPGDDWQLTTAKWAVEQNLFEGLPATPANDDPCPRSNVIYFLYLVCAE